MSRKVTPESREQLINSALESPQGKSALKAAFKQVAETPKAFEIFSLFANINPLVTITFDDTDAHLQRPETPPAVQVKADTKTPANKKTL